MIPEYFRNTEVPGHIKNKTQLIAWVLEEFIDDEPITNWEFVVELGSHRFGGIIHNLRRQGYEIVTLKHKKRGLVSYYCTKIPSKSSANIS